MNVYHCFLSLAMNFVSGIIVFFRTILFVTALSNFLIIFPVLLFSNYGFLHLTDRLFFVPINSFVYLLYNLSWVLCSSFFKYFYCYLQPYLLHFALLLIFCFYVHYFLFLIYKLIQFLFIAWYSPLVFSIRSFISLSCFPLFWTITPKY